MSPLFSELTQISSISQDIEVIEVIVDTRQTARFVLRIILLHRKCPHQDIHYSLPRIIFFRHLYASIFSVFQKNPESLIFISENASKGCGGSPCLQTTRCCLHSHFPQWFHSFLGFDVVSGTLKASKSISALVCQQFNTL